MLRWLTPDAYYDSIYDIELGTLAQLGVKGLIIDLDNTLIPRGKKVTPRKLIDWLDQIESKGLRVCIVSNNTNTRGKDISGKVKRPVISMARKPSRAAFKKALDILKTPEEETVVIGDQIFTDVFGGSRMGLKTILVVPLEGRDFIATVFMRKLERMVLKRLQKQNKLRKNQPLQ